MIPAILYCDECGTANRPQARFCFSCGQSLPSASLLPALSNPTIIKAPGDLSTKPIAANRLLKQRYRIIDQLGRGALAPFTKLRTQGSATGSWRSKTGNDPADSPFHFAPLGFQSSPVLCELEKLIMQMVNMDRDQRSAPLELPPSCLPSRKRGIYSHREEPPTLHIAAMIKKSWPWRGRLMVRASLPRAMTRRYKSGMPPAAKKSSPIVAIQPGSKP